MAAEMVAIKNQFLLVQLLDIVLANDTSIMKTQNYSEYTTARRKINTWMYINQAGKLEGDEREEL